MQRCVKPKRREPKVTIAIGFIGRPKHKHPKLMWGDLPIIIMASDSQSTHGSVKRVNPNKISVIDFSNGQILVAQARSVVLGDKFIEIMRKKADGKTLDDCETAINIIPIPKEIPHASYHPIKPECCAQIFPQIDTEVVSQELKQSDAHSATLQKKTLQM